MRIYRVMAASQFMSLNQAATVLHHVVCARVTPGGGIVVRFTPFNRGSFGLIHGFDYLCVRVGQESVAAWFECVVSFAMQPSSSSCVLWVRQPSVMLCNVCCVALGSIMCDVYDSVHGHPVHV